MKFMCRKVKRRQTKPERCPLHEWTNNDKIIIKNTILEKRIYNMSGHSKFANIKHKKEKNDAAKGKIFSDETAASELATDVTFKIANRGDVVDSHFGTYA